MEDRLYYEEVVVKLQEIARRITVRGPKWFFRPLIPEVEVRGCRRKPSPDAKEAKGTLPPTPSNIEKNRRVSSRVDELCRSREEQPK